MNERVLILGFALLCLVEFRSPDAFAAGWVVIEAPIKLGTKSARTSYNDSLPFKSWNWSATADSDASCLAKMAEKEQQDQEAWEIGMKVAAKNSGMSENEIRAKVPRVKVPRKCLRDDDPSLR